jgi:hypothetical protein
MSKGEEDTVLNGYKEALVIFIDILGSRNRTDFNELLEINELFYDELSRNKEQDREYVAYQRHIYTFSDCAYIFYDYKSNINTIHYNLGALFNVALCNCEPLLMKFLSRGLVFRGGVAYGIVYYDDNKRMFFGEAVNTAYTYEKEIAKYPRVLVDKFVAETIIDYKKQEDCIIKLDSDDQYYLHYLNSIQHGWDYSLIIGKDNHQFISNAISMCNTNMVKFSENYNICSKYEWLKNYIIQSSRNLTGEKVIYQKDRYDDMFRLLSKEEFNALTKSDPFCYMPNVDRSSNFDDFFKTVLKKSKHLKNIF